MRFRRDSRQKPAIIVALGIVALSAGARRGEAQLEPPRVFGGAPAASWIRDKDAPGDAFGVFHFRRVLELGARPERFMVHVSADNRYRLFVNGQQVSSGPQRSDLMHWRYETLDLAPHLRAGRNVLAALVWNWGPHRPVAQFSRHTAFLLQGDTEREAMANTGREWKVFRNPGYEPIPVLGDAIGGYYAAPPGESVDGSRYPWGWEGAGFPDDGWAAPAVTEGWGAERTQLRGTAITGEAMLWQLVPRSIPPMEEKVVRLATVRRAEGMAPVGRVPQGSRRPGSRAARSRDPPARPVPPHERLRRPGDERGRGQHGHPDLRRSPEGCEGGEGEPQRDRGQDDRRDQGRVPSGRRRAPPLPDPLVPHLSLRPARDRDRGGSAPHPRPPRDLHRVSLRGEGPLRERPALDRGHVEDELAGRAPLRVGDLLRHALLRAAPVRRRHADPGPDLALHERRRPPGAPGDHALRRLAPPRGDHGQPLPLGPGPVHPDLFPRLGRHGPRLLDAPGRSRPTSATCCPGCAACSAGTSASSIGPASSVPCPGGASWTGRRSGPWASRPGRRTATPP